MARMRRAILGALVAGLVGGAIAVPAAVADDFILPFNNYQVGGSLTVKKLAQDVELPPGSTFNGQANVTKGRLHGDVFVPKFTSTLKILGIPTKVTTQLTQVRPVHGTLTFDATGTHIRSSTSAIMHIRKLKLGLLSVATTCRTSEPIVLDLNFDGPLMYPIAFDGTTTIPRLSHCGLLGPTLSPLLAGPDNPYHLTLAPPPPAP